MFEHALIYNPDFGTEEDVDPQLVYSFHSDKHPQTQAQFVRLLGVAQGIAELTDSLGNCPVKWFKTGASGSAKFVIIAQLVETDSSNWRSGYWFAGQIAAPSAGVGAPPATVHPIVVQSFIQHRLTNGSVPHGASTEGDAYWSAFINQLNLNLRSPDMAWLVLCPDYLRVASGSLSPMASHGIQKLQEEYGVQEIMITSAEDGSAVYPGQKLGLSTRRALQVWLAQSSKELQKRDNKPQTHDSPNNVANHATEKPEPHQTSVSNDAISQETVLGSSEQTAENPASTESAVNPSLETPRGDIPTQELDAAHGHHDVEGNRDIEETSGTRSNNGPSLLTEAVSDDSSNPKSKSWFSIPSVLPIPSLSMPSLSIPSMTMPSLSMPSMSIPPSVSSLNVPWWSNSEKQETRDGFLVTSEKLFDLDSSPIYVTVWKNALYVYTVVCSGADEAEAAKSRLTPLFESLSLQMEGFSFAFAPPTRFYYLIRDPIKKTVVCTFNLEALTEVLTSVTEPPKSKQCVVRLGTTWLYFTTLDNGIEIVFGKKNVVSNHNTTLLGALHTDVQQWLQEFTQRGGLEIREQS